MTTSIIGLVIELLFLALGVYLYLFARGAVKVGKPDTRSRAEEFRRDNATWMRLLGLALAAVMLLNVILHVRELL
ncbi:hypothetical protein GGR28_000358 [Lewinella aquimaris]|uniref:Uncharacterized protein n=1 Tax=Neolewinella aquimaris TaxID=1835722 RepID=A0A840E3U9_9BACT|nr:hypothetical protein [Neolewinella aquimaris]MBB4077757.1 hypothetical protein [Neolewinella aquimaris]